MFRFLRIKFLSKDPIRPLGRWHNCGEQYNEKYMKLKEEQKLIRHQKKYYLSKLKLYKDLINFSNKYKD